MKIFKKGLFKDKLFKAFIMVGIIPLLLMGSFSYYDTSRLINEKVNTSVEENLEVMGKLIDSSIGTLVSITSYISSNEDVQEVLRKTDYPSYEEKFKDVQKIYKVTSSVLATQRLDVPIYIAGMNKYSRFTTTDYFPPIYSDLKADIFKQIDEKESKELLYIHRRVDGKERKDIVLSIGRQSRSLKEGDKTGYVILDVYDDYFNDIFKSVKVYKENNIYVLDSKGTIITDKLYKNKTGFKFYNEYVDRVLDSESGSFRCSIAGEQSIAYFTTLKSTGFKLVETVPLKAMYRDRVFIVRTFIILIALFGMFAIAASMILSKNISRPINKLSALMKKVENGELDVNFDIDTEDEIGQLGHSFNNMVREINRLIEEVYVKQYLLKEAEFKALKAQVNPHFLYNALESIKWMAKLENKEGVILMVTALGKFLRYSISSKGDIVTVREDIEQINNYLTIQKIRYGDKIDISVEIEENIYNKKLLKLLLQPLVENAIIHGMEQKRDKGKLWIKGYKQDERLCFEIIDDGIGLGNSRVKGEGIGLENVSNRIKLHYGEDYGVSLERKDELTIVRVTIPDRRDEEN
jgi:two-component system, sensor histidine kinase YesM